MTKTHTKTKTKTMTKTKCSKDPSHAMFSKSREFKDIKYDQTRPDFNLADLILVVILVCTVPPLNVQTLESDSKLLFFGVFLMGKFSLIC